MIIRLMEKKKLQNIKNIIIISVEDTVFKRQHTRAKYFNGDRILGRKISAKGDNQKWLIHVSSLIQVFDGSIKTGEQMENKVWSKCVPAKNK